MSFLIKSPFPRLQMVEEEASRRIEMLVKKRVEEELERRRSEIEAEVSRRVEEAKAKMERELILELEQRREAAREEERKREVGSGPVVGPSSPPPQLSPKSLPYDFRLNFQDYVIFHALFSIVMYSLKVQLRLHHKPI